MDAAKQLRQRALEAEREASDAAREQAFEQGAESVDAMREQAVEQGAEEPPTRSNPPSGEQLMDSLPALGSWVLVTGQYRGQVVEHDVDLENVPVAKIHYNDHPAVWMTEAELRQQTEALKVWFRLPLRCCLSFQRLDCPAKGAQCLHPPQCNYEPLLQLVGQGAEARRHLRCPVVGCEKPLRRARDVVLCEALRDRLSALDDPDAGTEQIVWMSTDNEVRTSRPDNDSTVDLCDVCDDESLASGTLSGFGKSAARSRATATPCFPSLLISDDATAAERSAAAISQASAEGIVLETSAWSNSGYKHVSQLRQNGLYSALYKMEGQTLYFGGYMTAAEAALQLHRAILRKQSEGAATTYPSTEVVEEASEEEAQLVVREAEGFTLFLSPRSSTGYLGVYHYKEQFMVKYRRNGQHLSLGNYASAVEGAVAYARFAAEQQRKEEEVVVDEEEVDEEEDGNIEVEAQGGADGAQSLTAGRGGAEHAFAAAPARTVSSAAVAPAVATDSVNTMRCERNPLCTRGFRHMGRGGLCSFKASAVLAHNSTASPASLLPTAAAPSVLPTPANSAADMRDSMAAIPAAHSRPIADAATEMVLCLGRKRERDEATEEECKRAVRWILEAQMASHTSKTHEHDHPS